MNKPEINREEKTFICKNCGKTFKDWRRTKAVREKTPPRFCSFSCQSSYTSNQPETKKKLIASLRRYYASLTPGELEETHRKALEGFQRKIEAGWRPHTRKRIRYTYNGNQFDGSWEAAYARYLDQHNTKWIRNEEKFEYFFEDRIHFYFPDFYLVDTDEYVEIKGYTSAKDLAKWEQFPRDKKLKVLREKELSSLFGVRMDRKVFKTFLEPDIIPTDKSSLKKKSRPKKNKKAPKEPKPKKKRNKRTLKEMYEDLRKIKQLKWELIKPFYGNGPTYGWIHKASQATGMNYSSIVRLCKDLGKEYRFNPKNEYNIINPSKGKRWITDGTANRLIDITNEHVPDGWYLGKSQKKGKNPKEWLH